MTAMTLPTPHVQANSQQQLLPVGVERSAHHFKTCYLKSASSKPVHTAGTGHASRAPTNTTVATAATPPSADRGMPIARVGAVSPAHRCLHLRRCGQRPAAKRPPWTAGSPGSPRGRALQSALRGSSSRVPMQRVPTQVGTPGKIR